MAGIQLRDYQLDAVHRMKNGCILCGSVGSGKSRTALAYYYLENDGILSSLNGKDEYFPMGDSPKDLYIITTARKRDTCEWEGELSPFLLSPNPEVNLYSNKVIIDSWNNIKKYSEIQGAFFIFDEQRVVGSGSWVKAFLKIAKTNQWILLSATPGDTWQDYIPVFIANGFYKNKSEFIRKHIIYSHFTKFPKVERYLSTGQLVQLRNSILINMDFKRETISHHEDVFVSYSIEKYKDICRTRWNPWENKPIENASGFCYALRKVVNSDESRQVAVLEIMEKHPKAIIFYNFDYELDILKNLFAPFYESDYEIAEWNGHKHQPIPESESWVYLVQYNAGAEGWNCIKTDTIIFYSQNYSYKVMVQSSGRIDRMNTPYTDLYYYHLKSRSGIDLAISKALKNKKKFNENGFYSSKSKINTKLSLFTTGNNNWETPQEIFDNLNAEFHFTLDPCAEPETAKCKKYYTKEDNGLIQDWGKEIVFCNPPYSDKQQTEWVKKCYEHGKNGGIAVMLIPARTDTKRFHEYIYNKAEIRFVRGRLKFGDSKNSAPFPSMVVIFGNKSSMKPDGRSDKKGL